MKTIGITGAGGTIGRTLREGFSGKYRLTLFDREPIELLPGEEAGCFRADCAQAGELAGLFTGLDAVVHLAATPHPAAAWSEVLPNNIAGTRNVLEEALRAGIGRVVFASTNHTQHGYAMKATPATLDTSFYRRGKKITLSWPPCPDSLYAVSKLFGEDLGRYFSRSRGLSFIALRIGWIIPGDDPTVKAGTDGGDLIRAIWLSKRDCVQAFTRAIETDHIFLIAYATSDNTRNIYDLAETREMLGFSPEDDAEHYFLKTEPGGTG